MIARFVLLSLAVAQVALGAAPTPQARAAFERGEQALAADQLQQAEAAYREAIAASPDYAAAINGLGSVYFKLSKRPEAIAQFRAAIAADPKFALAYFNLGYATRRTGDFAAAAEAYEAYTRLKPEDPDGFYGLGESYRQLGQREKAIAAYEQYVQREKRPSEQKWVDRARQMVTDLRAQLAAAPPPAAAPAAAAPAASPTVAAAQPAVITATPLAPQPSAGSAPDAARAKLDEGDRLMQQRMFREASAAYQEAVNASPSNLEALFKLGNSFAVQGLYDQAVDRWTRVVQLAQDPAVKKSAEDNIARARAKMAESQTPSSQPPVQPAAATQAAPPPSARAQSRAAYEKGVQQINARDFAGAHKSLTEAIAADPNLSVAYVARGSAQIGLRRFAAAAADYEYAHRLDPSLSSPLYGLAEAYRVLGRSSEARRYYEQYAKSNAPDVRPELQAQARQKAAQIQ
jgi:tetratricopeptide (TPR) repeat protein